MVPLAKEKAPEACATEAVTSSKSSTQAGVEQAKADFAAAFAESQAQVPAQWGDHVVYDPGERKRGWWFLLYPESMNPDFMKVLSESGYQGCVSPLHDQDRWSDGTRKKAHFHVLLYASGKVTARSLEPLVKAVGGVRLDAVGSIVGACRYLAHMDIDPEHVPSDQGKVHYSPDDIVCFGGFDAQSFLRATQTQVSKALRELYGLIEETGITSYWEFVHWMYDEKPEFDFMMANPQITGQIDKYIRSKWAVLHRNDEIDVLRQECSAQQAQVTRAVEAVSRMESVVDSLISAIKEASHVEHQ